MDNIFIDSENSENSDPRRLLLNFWKNNLKKK